MFAGPLRSATFFEANVVCLVVMYTDKVLRRCHMLLLHSTFWAERITVVVVEGGLGQGGGAGGRQMVSCSHFSTVFTLNSSSLVILALKSILELIPSKGRGYRMAIL